MGNPNKKPQNVIRILAPETSEASPWLMTGQPTRTPLPEIAGLIKGCLTIGFP